MTDSVKTVITKEGAPPLLKFRIKSSFGEEVLEESLVDAIEFLNMYRQLLTKRTQMTQQLARLEMQMNEKAWEKWPGIIKELREDLIRLDKQDEEMYKENFKICKTAVPEAQIQAMFRGLPIPDEKKRV